MRAPTVLLLALCVTRVLALPAAAASDSVLVVHDASPTSSHDSFLSSLSSLDLNVTYHACNTSLAFPLVSHGSYKYSTLVFLTTSLSSFPLSSLLQYLDAGHNVLLFLPSSPTRGHVALARSLGVDVSPLPLLDLLHSLSGDAPRAGFLAASVFGGARAGEVAFRGRGASVLRDNELVRVVAGGAASAYAGRPDARLARVHPAMGRAAVLAAATQTRAGGRAAYWGGMDAVTGAGATGDAMRALVRWTAGKTGRLRVREARCSAEVRVGDWLEVQVQVEEWRDGRWVQWTEMGEVRAELVMMDTWGRRRLTKSGGTWKGKLRVPDRIGVYKLKMEIRETGWTEVSEEKEIRVRPYAHDEFERFIEMAFPYYTAVAVMLLAVPALAWAVVAEGAVDGKKTR